MRRAVIPELLDDDLGTAAEIAETLSDLRHINQWFGGMRTTTALLRRVARECGCRKLSLLEVGAGAGDVPLAAQSVLAASGIGLQVTLLDRLWSHLPRGGTASVAGDALRLPFRNSTFDVVSCSLLAHHFVWPWFINPRAWKARAQRNQQREQLFHIREKIRQASHLTSALASSGPRRSAPLSPEVSEHLACRILAGYP